MGWKEQFTEFKEYQGLHVSFVGHLDRTKTSIAEKLEAIIHNGYLNSRYKDFYDIYVLSKKYEFSYEMLRNAVIQTFEHRNTQMTMDSAAFSDEVLNDPMHQTRWKAFLNKKKALIQVSLPDVMDWIKAFVHPLLDGTKKARWNPEKGIWEQQ